MSDTNRTADNSNTSVVEIMTALEQRQVQVTTDISAKIINMILEGYKPKIIVETIIRGNIKIPSRVHTMESYAKYKARQIALDEDFIEPVQSEPQEEQNEEEPGLERLNIKSMFGLNMYRTRKLFNETALYTYRYIVLDTSRSSGYDFNTKKYKWNYNGTPLVEEGVASSTGPIKNIVGMRSFPIVMKNFRTFRDLYNIYTLTIDELVAQSFIGHERQRYHFMYRTRNVPVFGLSDSNEFNPRDFNRGYFWFRTPIQSINSFTISMANPVQIVDIPAGIQSAIISTFNNPLQLVFSYPHGLLSGGIIIISNFTTNDPVTDAVIIASVNSSAGHVITVIDDLTISIPVDGTLITAPREVVVNCLDTNNKTLFAFEFICEKEELPGDDSYL